MNDLERSWELNEQYNIKHAKTKEYQDIRDSINKDNNRSFGNKVSSKEIEDFKELSNIDNYLSWLKI